MKVPSRWLADYVEIEITHEAIDRLAERLTLAGLEVEDVLRVDPIQNAVVGHVVSCEPHPDSDHLSVCHVETGTETVQIICGASNVVAGAQVPVVLAGGVLPGGFRIEKRKLRGVESNGMICSKAELGLEDKSDGIWIFDPALELQTGTDLNDLFEFDDYILDFKVFSNRPDCASVYGVAREVAAVLDLPLRPLDTAIDVTPGDSGIRLTIEDPRDTPRYAARMLRDVRVGPSSLRVQHRLIKAGMRPLSNVVDATNYAMLEVGHPLHPFDADLLDGGITIRRATPGSTFRTLDDLDRALTDANLMICDDEGDICIAGVMGGQRSEIGPDTRNVLLEIAVFYGHTIRMSSRALGLRSEASHRFERRLDPEGVRLAADRAVHLLQQTTGCQVLGDLADNYPAPSTPRKLVLRPARAVEVLGFDLNANDIVGLLARLQIPAHQDGDQVHVEVPYFRPDLEREIDLVEEVGRIHGYDRLQSVPPLASLRVGRKDRTEHGKDTVRDLLVSAGMYEIMTDGFDKPAWRERLGIGTEDLVAVRNPMSASQAAMRGSMLPGILGVVETNLSHGVDGGRVFELGRVFSKSHGETESVAGALFGRTGTPLRGKEKVTVSLAKGLLDGFLTELRIEEVSVCTENLPPYLHPGRSGWLIAATAGEDNTTTVGLFGELLPTLADELPTPAPVIVFEFALQPLISQLDAPVSYQPLPKHPSSKRDLSLTAPAELPETRIREAIRAEPEVDSVLLYDVYQGEQVGEGRKSLTYEIAVRAEDRTLTDEETAEIIARIEARLADLHVHVRTQ